MTVSEQIAAALLQRIALEGEAEFQRNDFAQQVGCVPSQINYVLSSRFRPEQGYLVESRRGGGGYIRISRIPMSADNGCQTLLQLISTLPDQMDVAACHGLAQSLVNQQMITITEGKIMLAALSDQALKGTLPQQRDALRASILKHILPVLASAQSERSL